MIRLFSILSLLMPLTHSAYAGLNIGMPGAIIKRVKKLDDKVNEQRQQNYLPPAALGEWVLVPGSSTLGTSNFYVMKYEAKNVGGVPVSQADGAPWVSLRHSAAVTACAALGGGAHLITIAEAQTINRNIETQAANWANGVIGSLISSGGGLKRGNGGITDSTCYDGADPEYGEGRDTKAKLVLSNGSELWDWSGNVEEWLYSTGANGTLGVPSGVTFETSTSLYSWDNIALNEERPIIGPSNGGWGEIYGTGRYYGGVSTNVVFRGGEYLNGNFSGVFAFQATHTTSFSDPVVGFRCAK